MKRKIVLISLCVLIVSGIFCAFISRKPTVNSFITNVDPEGYDADITITLNRWFIWSEDKTKEYLTSLIIANDFENMQFPYEEMGFPEEINITVYTNSVTKKLGIHAIQFRHTAH